MEFYDSEKINKMRKSAQICSDIMSELQLASKVGVSLLEIDSLAYELMRKNAVMPAFLGYEGFPNTICACVNEVVQHGIPTDYRLKEGDIFSIDTGIRYMDVYSDMAVTIPIGEVSEVCKSLINTTKKAVLAGIANAKPGNRVGDIGNAMQTVIEGAKFSVVRDLVGHGVGYDLHESPSVPGYGTKGLGEKLYKGQTLAIEAMVNEGKPGIVISREDGWTCRTEDGKLSALFEHTIVVDDRPEILTKW